MLILMIYFIYSKRKHQPFFWCQSNEYQEFMGTQWLCSLETVEPHPYKGTIKFLSFKFKEIQE